MNYLLYAGILGFSFWICSEVIEIYLSGYNAAVYYLTALYHVFAGFGVWGLHKIQSGQCKNVLSAFGAATTLIAYVGVIYFPIEVMHSGLTIPEFLNIKPIYKIPGALWLLGMLMFGVSVLKSKHFPIWTGVVILLGAGIFVATPLLNWPAKLANVSNILLAATFIYLCTISLRQTVK